MEDGTDEVVSNVLMIVVRNTSERTLQYAEISLKADGKEAVFNISTLPPGEEMVALEKNRTEYVSEDEYKLYRLIYYRALSSLMKDAKVMATTIILDNNNYQFKATGQILIFDGYLKVYSDYEENNDKILPDLNKDNSKVVIANNI